ncbi:MAG: DNA polymerase III subunit beta [Candidatus Curtissbacteria bacterium]|nr:DNA polymerase III subunit beta [Candidatus Curtissbacteria bacterium]
MKFKIEQGQLTKTLLSVNKSLLSKVNLPILSNVLFSVSGNKLEVLSTNLETATKVVVDCTGEADGKTTLPGKTLLEFVSQLPEGEILLEKLGEEVIVSTKGYNARFATLAVEDFPAIPKIEKGKHIKLDPKDFMRAVSRVAMSAAQDEGRPILTGVLCEFEKKTLSCVATDGYRLSFQSVPYEGDIPSSLKIVVPSKSLIEAAKIVSELSSEIGENKIELLIADGLNQVNFKIGNVEFTSRLIEGEFPNWQKIIPSTFASKARVSKEDFIKVIRIASIFARDSGNIIRLQLLANGAKGAVLKVFANNVQVGSNEAEAEVELTGKGGEIAFNFKYLLEMLSSIESSDVEFEMIESLNPGRLTVPEDKSYFHIVMPVRLQT